MKQTHEYAMKVIERVTGIRARRVGSYCRVTKVVDARRMYIMLCREALYYSQERIAGLLSISQQAVSKKQQEHANMLDTDAQYRKHWNQAKSEMQIALEEMQE